MFHISFERQYIEAWKNSTVFNKIAHNLVSKGPIDRYHIEMSILRLELTIWDCVVLFYILLLLISVH